MQGSRHDTRRVTFDRKSTGTIMCIPQCLWGTVHTCTRYLCELPLDRGVDPGANKSKALHEAVTTHNVDVVRYLCELPLDRGVDPSAENNLALRLAVEHGHLDVVQYLCELPLRRGMTPRTGTNVARRLAVQHGHLDIVEYLNKLLARGVGLHA